MLLAIAAAGLLFAQAEAQVATPAAPVPAAKPAPPEKPKQICRSESQIGSNFSKRVCHTADEWKAVEAVAREQSEAMRNCKNGMGC